MPDLSLKGRSEEVEEDNKEAKRRDRTALVQCKSSEELLSQRIL